MTDPLDALAARLEEVAARVGRSSDPADLRALCAEAVELSARIAGALGPRLRAAEEGAEDGAPEGGPFPGPGG